ncbi:uncharacterized protein UTRI_04533_B [Ustilago trichophora]|uniref:Uncharacterized protein n=1 Tax=Ustilago trichophora TaxID=86804 RepID=A0A5C3EBZ7_9BASI|nr:uncharacterized protein UTRI_04533_B [Ustilago trichophora]
MLLVILASQSALQHHSSPLHRLSLPFAMKLLLLMRSSVITAAVALLMTSLIFTAAMRPGEASSSSGPSAGPSGSGTVRSRMDLDTYIGKLKARNIDKVHPSISGRHTGHLLPDVPFYGRIPVFTTDSRVEAVEQALVDYKRLVIVDLQRGTARDVVYYRGSILQEGELPPEQVQKFLFMYKFDGNLHVLMKHFQPGAPQGRYWPQRLPEQGPVDHLPHFDQVPILKSRQQDLPHMLGASRSGARKFWLRRPDGDYLIDPHAQPHHSGENIYKVPVIQIASEAQTQNINEVLQAYGNAEQQYGEGTASLRYGAPVPLSREYQRERIKPPRLHKYKRFTMIGGTRPELLLALQKDGRYRLYDTVDPHNGPYKVIVKNPRAPPGTPMDIGIELLTPAERQSESFLERMRLIQLPH